MFDVVLPAKPLLQSIYGLTVLQMENWPQNLHFCIFDLHFGHILPLFASLRAPTAIIYLRKHLFDIILSAKPLLQSIYGFTVFQMENWPQNLPFSVFDHHFGHFRSGLHFCHPINIRYEMLHF